MAIHQLTISGKDAKKIVDATGNSLSFEKLVDCDKDEFYGEYGMLTNSLFFERLDQVKTKKQYSELMANRSEAASPWFNLFTGESDYGHVSNQMKMFLTRPNLGQMACVNQDKLPSFDEYWDERDDGYLDEPLEHDWDVEANFGVKDVYRCYTFTNIENGNGYFHLNDKEGNVGNGFFSLIPDIVKKYELFEFECVFDTYSENTSPARCGQYMQWIFNRDAAEPVMEAPAVDYLIDGKLAEGLEDWRWEQIESMWEAQGLEGFSHLKEDYDIDYPKDRK